MCKNQKKIGFKPLDLFDHIDFLVEQFLSGNSDSIQWIDMLCKGECEGKKYKVEDPAILPKLYLKIFKVFGADMPLENLNWIDINGWNVSPRVKRVPFETHLIIDNVFDLILSEKDIKHENIEVQFVKVLFADPSLYEDYKFMLQEGQKEQLPVLVKKVLNICGADTDISWIDTSNWVKCS